MDRRLHDVSPRRRGSFLVQALLQSKPAIRRSAAENRSGRPSRFLENGLVIILSHVCNHVWGADSFLPGNRIGAVAKMGRSKAVSRRLQQRALSAEPQRQNRQPCVDSTPGFSFVGKDVLCQRSDKWSVSRGTKSEEAKNHHSKTRRGARGLLSLFSATAA